ncbi:Angiomotin-like protein 1 [Orchesella cincta]|uniref:Angiomotin-like protein 1 n=1 Tax=Orchesella cincta TaxID=48709 RepID=A0A1D2MGI4_ORCCI|nr:Angiomotin-like protein 1 [Orchesella cincta]
MGSCQVDHLNGMDNPLLSSTEELSPEDRLLLTCTKRQEPQGEEHRSDNGTDMTGKDNSSGSGYCHQLMGLTRTKKKLQSSSSSSSSSDSESDSDLEDDEHHDMKPDHYYSSAAGGISSNTNSISSRSSLHRNSGTHPCNLSLDSNSHSAYNTLIIHQNNSSLLADTWIPASHEFTSVGMGQNRNSGCSASRKSQSPTRDISSSLSQSGGCEGLLSERSGDSAVTSTELLDIPRDYLDQLTVLKHLAKEVQQDPISSSIHPNLLRSASFSRSQPDLTHATIMSTNPHSCTHDFDYYDCSKPQSCQQPQQGQQWKKMYDNQSPLANVSEKCEDVLPSVQILEILMRENSNLKAELANARRRIQTIHKLEAELTRLQKDHASLFEVAERRESLERTARAKLTTEVKRLTAVNRELLSSSNSLQNISPYAMSSDLDAYKMELGKKDVTLSKLISDNKELIATKERQEIELAAQRATLAEQRTHIDILDSALTNAQQNVLRLEEECRKKQEYVEKVSQLQRALSSLQLSNEKREQSEKKLRSQLESEITDLKLQLASVNAASNTNINNRNQGSQSQPGSTPNTPNSWSSRGETPHFFGNGSSSAGTLEVDLPSTHNRAADLEKTIKDLESRLVERDAMIRVLHLQNAPPPISSLSSNLYSSFNSSSSSAYISPMYRESPCYSSVTSAMKNNNNNNKMDSNDEQKARINHQPSMSLASAMGNMGKPMGTHMDPALFYSKVTKCDSEPPSYANLPSKLRLGGSGSSLAKNSNESLGSVGQTSNASSSHKNSSPGSIDSSRSNTKSIDEQLKELDNQLLSKDSLIQALQREREKFPSHYWRV